MRVVAKISSCAIGHELTNTILTTAASAPSAFLAFKFFLLYSPIVVMFVQTHVPME